MCGSGKNAIYAVTPVVGVSGKSKENHFSTLIDHRKAKIKFPAVHD